MLIFEHGNKLQKEGFFAISRAWAKEKVFSSQEELDPRHLDSECSTTGPMKLPLDKWVITLL